ncbi:ABC transporter permease [Ornithinimicrobium faecis]|uniref:ABC transporter permease n=1 Tax=Ornithinimicrobium faecis TaxID=2934158 RepID=A0ABY4YVR1_9MICO|nr:ABC transporter permease [Ornithinimicrobium sp. HY1793]USQ80842.1 ABC transporter permease [Ornithinimicrobium sp. HY1793]
MDGPRDGSGAGAGFDPDVSVATVAPKLRTIGRRPPLGIYLHDLWQRRHFIYADSRARAFSGNRDYLLGNLWLIGKPILDGLTYYIIFALILKVDRGMDNFVGFLLIGIFMFTFTTRATNSSVSAMISSRNLLQSFSFPRASIPLAVLTREILSMAPVLATMFLLLIVLAPNDHPVEPGWTWVLFPVVFLLQALFNAGVVLYCARLGSALPDLKFFLGFLTRLWFYGSGVIFPITRFVQHEFWLAVLQANPMYLVLEMSRDILLSNTVPDARSWMILGAWAVVTPLMAFLYFWQGEESYAQQQ